MVHGTARSDIALIVDIERCQICKRCTAGRVCRGNAFLRIDRGEPPFLDMSRCWGCMACIPACPFDAVVRYDPLNPP